MGTLECKGVFELVVPDGWSVTGEPGRYYEIHPPIGTDIEVNISVYGPEPAPMRALSTADLVRHFATSAGYADVDTLEVATIPETGQERSFTGFSLEGRDWFAGALRFDGGGVLASGNVPTADGAAFRQVETIVAMIAPAPKKGLFRRR